MPAACGFSPPSCGQVESPRALGYLCRGRGAKCLRCSDPFQRRRWGSTRLGEGRRLEEDPRYWDKEMDPGAKRTRVLFFQHFSRRNRSGVRIGHFQSKLKTRRLEERTSAPHGHLLQLQPSRHLIAGTKARKHEGTKGGRS